MPRMIRNPRGRVANSVSGGADTFLGERMLTLNFEE